MKKTIGLILILASFGSHARTEIATKNFPVSTTISKSFFAPEPRIQPSFGENVGKEGALLFSVNLTVPENVSQVTVYPVYDEDYGLGRLVNTADASQSIIYQIVDEKGKKMLKDHGAEVTPNQQITFKALNYTSGEKKYLLEYITIRLWLVTM